MVTCKITSECKIFLVENILRKGKHFHLFGCVLGNLLKKHFRCLVPQCKTFSRENVKKYLLYNCSIIFNGLIDQIYGSVMVFNFWHTKTNQLQPKNKSLLLPQPNHENKTKKTLHYKWEQPHKNLNLKISITGCRS